MTRIKDYSLMKTLGITMFLALLSISASAQLRPLWSVTASVEADELILDDGFDHHAPAAIGFAVNAFASQGFGKHFVLRLGLGYANKGVHRYADGLIMEYDISPSNGVIGSSTLEEKSRFHEIQMPVLFQYHLQSMKQGIFWGLGPMPTYFVANKVNIDIASTTGAHENFNSAIKGQMFNLAVQGCIGYQIPLPSERSLGLEAYGNWYANQYYVWPARMVNLGLRAGITL
jgi:hypothetical protein